jgi:hypothetical protein
MSGLLEVGHFSVISFDDIHGAIIMKNFGEVEVVSDDHEGVNKVKGLK